jgi:predicted transposase YdaD
VTKPWVHSMKLLVWKNPQSLVSFLLPDAVFESEIDRELTDLSLAADVLYVVKWQGKQIVLHVEFQGKRHIKIGRRLWKYNATIHMRTNLPVYSVVIYVVEDTSLVESPYVVPLPDGRATQRLDFETIKLWEIVPEVLEQQGLVGLLPLLPLTKGGQKREMVERMIKGLEKAGQQDLLVLGYAFSSLVLTTEDDVQWLKARFFIMRDILRDTWVFQEIIKEGLEQGEERGLKRGLIRFVEIRFPTLLVLAEQRIEQATSLEQIQMLLDRIYQAGTIEDARTALL